MNIIVSGGRVRVEKRTICMVLDAIALALDMDPDTVIYHGDADGTDRYAGAWAKTVDLEVVPVPIDKKFDGDLDDAPKRRNTRMKEMAQPEVVICFPGGPGTRHMMDISLADPDILTGKLVVLDVDLFTPGNFEVWNVGARGTPARLLCFGLL